VTLDNRLHPVGESRKEHNQELNQICKETVVLLIDTARDYTLVSKKVPCHARVNPASSTTSRVEAEKLPKPSNVSTEQLEQIQIIA